MTLNIIVRCQLQDGRVMSKVLPDLHTAIVVASLMQKRHDVVQAHISREAVKEVV